MWTVSTFVLLVLNNHNIQRMFLYRSETECQRHKLLTSATEYYCHPCFWIHDVLFSRFPRLFSHSAIIFVLQAVGLLETFA